MRTTLTDAADRKVIGNDHAGLTLGFVRRENHRPPTWTDSRYPQQVHLDIPVYNGQVAGELMTDLGAVRLPSRGGGCPVYADPAGHPFCLCTNQLTAGEEWPALPGLVGNIVLDCPKPQLLSSLYSTLLGSGERMNDAKGWVVIVPRAGVRPRMAFQGSEGHQPGWRDDAHPQQAMLQLETHDLKATMGRMARLGLRQLDETSAAEVIYLDPAGYALMIQQSAAAHRPEPSDP